MAGDKKAEPLHTRLIQLLGCGTKEKRICYFWRQQERKNYGRRKHWKSTQDTNKKVLFVNALKHNLLSIRQLCDKGFKIEFNKNCCMITANYEYILRLNYIGIYIFSLLILHF